MTSKEMIVGEARDRLIDDAKKFVDSLSTLPSEVIVNTLLDVIKTGSIEELKGFLDHPIEDGGEIMSAEFRSRMLQKIEDLSRMAKEIPKTISFLSLDEKKVFVELVTLYLGYMKWYLVYKIGGGKNDE